MKVIYTKLCSTSLKATIYLCVFDANFNSNLTGHLFSDTQKIIHNIQLICVNLLSLYPAVQDAASKRINNVLLDTSDLAISQYSLLGQTPPRSAPDSPATHARATSSAAPSEEPAPVVEDSHLHDDANHEACTTDNFEQSPVTLYPLIVVTQQCNDSSSKEECTSEESRKEVHLDADGQSTTAKSNEGQEVGPPNVPANPDCPEPSASPSSPQASPDVTADCVQSDQAAVPEKSATPDLSSSEHPAETQTSDQNFTTTSHPPCTNSPMKISLGILSEAIGHNVADPPERQAVTHSTTDRAVYLSGEIKDNWEIERVKDETQREVQESIKEGTKETGECEKEIQESVKGEETIESAVQTMGEPVDKICQASEPPAGSTATSSATQESEEKEGDNGGQGASQAEERQEGGERDHEVKKEKENDELLQVHQPTDSGADCAAELLPGNVDVIRELVTEVIEVEVEISPYSSPQP